MIVKGRCQRGIRLHFTLFCCAVFHVWRVVQTVLMSRGKTYDIVIQNPGEGMTIRILSTQAANQIVAGEAVERPASIVRKLTGNAINASSTNFFTPPSGSYIL